LGPAIMYSANTIVFTAGALAFMLSISPKLTLYAFLPLPIVSIVIQYFGRRIHERFEKIQAMFSEISARVQENFSGVRVVRAYVQERAETAAFEKSNREYIARSLKLVRLMGMLWPTLETMLGLAIVRPTGSGKTTLVSLIPRIYDADPGSVLIDGEPVRDYPLTDLRRNIGFVPQETFLFSETIRENIAFGVQRASDEEVSWAAE